MSYAPVGSNRKTRDRKHLFLTAMGYRMEVSGEFHAPASLSPERALILIM
jgi:hypothetical protein